MTSDSEPTVAVDVGVLLDKVGAGDQAAFAALYDCVAARVHGLVRRILVDDAQSQEVTQEVFLEIWQTAPRFDRARGSALGWIFTITHRRAVDRVRSSQSGRDRDDRVANRDVETAYDPVAEAGDIRIEAERVRRAMQGLSDAHREAITLAYYGGYSQSEIAAATGAPLGTVKTRLRDGMNRLRAALGVTA
ncbi:ECF RNA polymerase sigma factor SigK [Paramicrobacterium humi]|uniref:ECF RNA polymerase sigma factor SigK n=1 Tax=Paramicrobacterium humi TaxID=640635 RepID=UPI001FE22444|nr:ECF RNA polymerase sigma factor SigK [Microbacterium humi]